PAVAVEVHGQHAEALAVVLARPADAQAGRAADITERTVAVVAVEQVRHRVEVGRRADVPPLAVRGGARLVALRRPIDITADVQVGVAVAVEVGPGGAGTPAVGPQAGPARHLDEAPPAAFHFRIAEQGDPAEAGDEEVGPA